MKGVSKMKLTNKLRKSSYFNNWHNPYENDERAKNVHAETALEGMHLSINHIGKVSVPYIAQITGKSCEQVLLDLEDHIYRNPEKWNGEPFSGLETKEEYLSGNLQQKLDAAKLANKRCHGAFDRNIAALKNALPSPLKAKDISVTLGSPWLPPGMIDQFIEEEFGFGVASLPTKHDTLTGTWTIPNKNRYGKNAKVNSTYGTRKLNALAIIEKTLNCQKIEVCDTDASGKRNVNYKETTLALEKQSKLIRLFQKWIWSDGIRKAIVIRTYQRTFGTFVPRTYDGSFLTFPDMNPECELYPYQKDAVLRILLEPNTLLAHDVGSGKTIEMLAAGMKLRQTGLSKKNMYVVPNAVLGQWITACQKFFPNAKIMVLNKDNCSEKHKKERHALFKRIQQEEWDGIFITEYWFDKLLVSREYLLEQSHAQKVQIQNSIAQGNDTTDLKRFEKHVKKRISELIKKPNAGEQEICFDELGITRLFIDESHHYKNIPFDGFNKPISGINPNGCQKSEDMLNKIQCVQQMENGGVVLGTGTPLSNSISDVYNIQRCLQFDVLEELGLLNFRAWSLMFAEINQQVEADVDPSKYRVKSRLTSFQNIPELQKIFLQVADFHHVNRNEEIPQFNGYTDIISPRTEEMEDFFLEISERTEKIRNHAVDRKEDNMLKITTDGRMAALDLRLLGKPYDQLPDSPKVMMCVKNAYEIWRETEEDRLTQVIFCDMGVPKLEFNIYDVTKRLLVEEGVPAKEIAFIHDVNTENAKLDLFDKVRKGEIRILIGSTSKLGTGVNIQDRLVALHHLDVPWRPADLTQREGRILRVGNQNKEVKIYRYITQGSFDAYSWQILASKQKFISQFLSNSQVDRSCADIDSTVLSCEEAKALAIRNPEFKKYVEVKNELETAKILEDEHKQERRRLENLLSLQCTEISQKQEQLEAARLDVQKLEKEEMPNAEERKLAVEKLQDAMKEENRTSFLYCGFEISVKDQIAELKGNSTYHLSIGDSASGNMIRIDHFIRDLSSYVDRLQNSISLLAAEKARIQDALLHIPDDSHIVAHLEETYQQYASIIRESLIENES